MKNTRIHYKQFAILTRCVLILAMLVSILCSSAGSALAQSKEDVNDILNEMTTYIDFQQNERLYDLTLNHIATNMNADASISKTKQLMDFDGNNYTLFELSPIGYAIFHVASGKYVEYAEESYSPYLGYHSNLYYGGGMQYYYLQNGFLKHTFKNDLIIPANSIFEMATDSNAMSNAFCDNSALDNLSFVNDGVPTGGVAIINGSVEQKEIAQTRASARIGMTSFFPALDTSTKMGYRDGGVCGYIAANLLLGYSLLLTRQSVL